MNCQLARLNTAALVFACSLGLAGCGGGGPIPAPTEFKTYQAHDDAFQIDYPADWKAEGGGKQGMQWAQFTRGAALVKVGIGVTGSILGDIASGGRVGFGDGEELSPEEKEARAPVTHVHQLRKEVMAEEYSEYQESTASNIQVGLGPARKGEFTASAGLGRKIHGYHVTVLSRDYRVTVLCLCPESDWTTLQPAFDRIVASVQ
jgi:hypothetical protein